jgi:hypothetical protein
MRKTGDCTREAVGEDDGQYSVVNYHCNGRWPMQWSMVNARVNGQWPMVNGQWSIVNGHWSLINI